MSSKKMTPESFENICLALETTHKGINTLCNEHNTHGRYFYEFKDGKNQEDRQENLQQYEARHKRYTRARDKQLDYLEELLRERAFENKNDKDVVQGVNIGANHIQRNRLEVDTLKFILGKLRARKWGDKLDVTTNGKEIQSVNVTIVRPGEDPEDNDGAIAH